MNIDLTNPQCIVFGLLPKETQEAMKEASKRYACEILNVLGNWEAVRYPKWATNYAYRISYRQHAFTNTPVEGTLFWAMPPSQQAKLQQAHKAGKTLQIYHSSGWKDIPTANTVLNGWRAYRIKPEPEIMELPVETRSGGYLAGGIYLSHWSSQVRFRGFRYGDVITSALCFMYDPPYAPHPKLRVPDAVCVTKEKA